MANIHKLVTRNDFISSMTVWYKLLYLTTNTSRNDYGNEFWNLPSSIDFDFLALSEEFHLYVIHNSHDGWYAELWYSDAEKEIRKSNPYHMAATSVDARQITMKHPNKEILLEALSKNIAVFQDDSNSESRKRRNAIKEGKEVEPYAKITRCEAEELRDKILVRGRSNELRSLETHGGIDRSTEIFYEVHIQNTESVHRKESETQSVAGEKARPESLWRKLLKSIKTIKLLGK